MSRVNWRFDGIFRTGAELMKIVYTMSFLCLMGDSAWSDPPIPPARTESAEPTELPADSGIGIAPLPDDALTIEPPALPPSDDPAAQRIREALQNGPTTPTPGLLGDVLDVIRQKGSILDGSILDPKMADNPDSGRPSPSAGELPQGDFKPTQNDSDIVETAELLLRSARRLERVAGDDDQSVRLIRQMRVRATSMLADLYFSP